MTAINHYHTANTAAWEAGLPRDSALIEKGMLQKSPFPIIEKYRARRMDDLLGILSQGADLQRQREAWDLVIESSKMLDMPPHWVMSSFDGVIAQLCNPNLRHAPVHHELSIILSYGNQISYEQVSKAWNGLNSGSKGSQRVALHHLWLESHPMRNSIEPGMLGKGQQLMMALSFPKAQWLDLIPGKFRDMLFSIDLGL